MKPNRLNSFITAATVVASVTVLLTAIQTASAATRVKLDNLDDLNLATSWFGGAIPSSADVATWDSTVTGANSTVLGANQNWGGIAITSPGGAVTIGGANTLTLGTSGIDMSAATQNLTISSNLTLESGVQTWNVATGRTLTISSATLTRSAGATLLIDKSTNTGTVTASPALTNGVLPWAIVKSAGTAANNSAAGYNFATVTSGNITAYTGATAVTTSYPANSATANYDWSASGTQGQIGSSRAANTIRYTGTGVTQATNSAQTETFNALMNAGTGTVTLGGGSTMNIQSANGELVLAAMTAGITINGPIINNGATAGNVIVMGGSGQTITLGGSSTFSGNLTINSGTLAAGTGQGSTPTASNLGALQPASNRNIIVNNGGTLSLTGGNVLGTGGSTNTLSNTTLVVNQGGLFRSGLDGSGAGWWNKIGATNLNGGTIRIGSGANTTAFQGLALIGTVTVAGSSASSIENFAASNSASNGVHLGQNATASQSITFDVANVTGDSATDLSVSTSLLNTSSTLTASGLTKTGAGTMTLTGNNAYTGGTVISNGTLQVGNGGTAGSIAAASAITNSANLVYNRSDSFTQGSAISGSGTLTKLGAGTLTLTGALTHAGVTSVSNGTLALGTSQSSIGSLGVADGAGLSVKAAAAGTSLLTSTSLTLGSSGTITLGFDFNNLNTTAAQIVTGAFTANGTINVSFSNGALLASGTHTLIDYSSFSGSGVLPTGTFTLSPRSSAVIVNDLSGTALNLNVTTDTPKWTGLDSGNWSVGGTGGNSNWKLVGAGSATDFIASDVVLFDDSATGTTLVDINAANVAPVSTTFSNSTLAYTVTSSGGFGISSGLVTKGGSGSLTIQNANTYAGGTTLNAGTLNVNNNAALGTGAVTINGGTLDNTSGSAVTLAANNAQTWSGDFTFIGSNDLNMGNGNVTLSGGDRALSLNGGTLTTGKLTNAAGGFIKNGVGTLQLNPSGASTLTGALAVNGGTLGIGSQDLVATGLSGTGTIQNGSATTRWLVINNTTDQTFSGTLANGGVGALGFRKGGSGKMTLSGTNSYTDPTTIDAGTLEIQGANTGAGTNVTLGANTNLVIGNSSALGTNSVISLAGNTTGTVTFKTDGSITPYDASFGSGTTNFNVVLDSAGATTVTHGLSTGTNTNGVGRGNLNISLGGAVTSGTLQLDTFNMGAGSTGSNTVVNPGAGVTVIIGSSEKANNNVSQTLELSGVGTGHQVTGAIANGAALTGGATSISVVKSGSSTWTLSGTNTYTGTTSVTAGKLVVNGSISTSVTTVSGTGTLGGSGSVGSITVASGGTLSPGNSPGILNTGNVDLQSGSTLAIELNGDTAGTGYDQLNVTGTVALAGTLDLSLGYAPVENTMFFIINNDGTDAVTGTFSGLADNDWFQDGSQWFKIGYSGDAGTNSFTGGNDVVLMAVPEPGATLLGSLGVLALLRRRRVS